MARLNCFSRLVALLLLAASPARAATLNFTFSFYNTSYDSGYVTGVVLGLQDDATSAATSVKVLTNSAVPSYGIADYVSFAAFNSWTVASGQIHAYKFLAFGGLGSLGGFVNSSLWLDSTLLAEPISGLSYSITSVTADVASGTALKFTAILPPPMQPPLPPPVPAPLPASVSLILAALAGLVVTRRCFWRSHA
jgi:hypothetical protein